LLEKLVLIVLLKPKAFCFVQENPKYITEDFGYRPTIVPMQDLGEYQEYSTFYCDIGMLYFLASIVQFDT